MEVRHQENIAVPPGFRSDHWLGEGGARIACLVVSLKHFSAKLLAQETAYAQETRPKQGHRPWLGSSSEVPVGNPSEAHIPLRIIRNALGGCESNVQLDCRVIDEEVQQCSARGSKVDLQGLIERRSNYILGLGHAFQGESAVQQISPAAGHLCSEMEVH